MAEELEPKAGGEIVGLVVAASLLEDGARTEGIVELLRSPRAGMEMNSQNGSKSWNTAEFGS